MRDASHDRNVVLATVVAALGYFVDIFDLLLFALVRVRSLKDLLGDRIAAEQDRILAEVLRDDRHEKDLRPEFRPDGDTTNEEEAPKSLSEVGASRPSGLEGASVGSGLDAAKPRRDTVPR